MIIMFFRLMLQVSSFKMKCGIFIHRCFKSFSGVDLI